MRVLVCLATAVAFALPAQARGTSLVPGVPYDGTLRITMDESRGHRVLVDGKPIGTRLVAHSNGPLAIVVVMCGWTGWIGRDELPLDSLDPHLPGALADVREALGEASSKSWPAGTEIAVVSYGEGTRQLAYRRPVSTFDPSWLGTQKDFDNERTESLWAGIAVGIDELITASPPRKALIVIGDGWDNNTGALDPRIYVERAREHGIELFSVIWQLWEEEPAAIRALVPDSIRVSEPKEIRKELHRIFESLRLRDEIEIEIDLRRLPWDGGLHVVELERDGVIAARSFVRLPAPALAVHDDHDLAWILLIVGLTAGSVGATASITRRTRARRARLVTRDHASTTPKPEGRL